MTNSNMTAFVMACWENKSRPNVEQGRKRLSHSLTASGRPPLTRFQRQYYGPTLDVLKGLAKDPAWRAHKSGQTEAFDLTTCKKLFHACVLDENGVLDLKALRNKTLAICMIVNGWHPIDAYRVKETDVTDECGFIDRSGEHRPKLIFAGKNVHHTKQHHIKVRNVIGCGCHKDHNAQDPNCFYNVVKLYMMEKKKSDDIFLQNFKKLNKSQRAVHVDEEGDLRSIGFFRAMNRRGRQRCTRHWHVHLHENMGDNTIREVFECGSCSIYDRESRTGTSAFASRLPSACSQLPRGARSAPSATSTPRVVHELLNAWCFSGSPGRL